MPRMVLPEQVILVSQLLNLEREAVEQSPNLARPLGFHSASLGNGRLLPCSYSSLAASLIRCNFFTGSASFFSCLSQSSSSTGFSRAASSHRSSGVSCSMAALISCTRLMSRIYPLMRPRTRGDESIATIGIDKRRSPRRTPLQPGQASFAEPGERAPDVRDTFESERLDRFVSNVRDRFLDRIGSVNQFEICSGNHSTLGHFVDEPDQFFPIIGSHDHDREVFDFAGLNQRRRLE